MSPTCPWCQALRDSGPNCPKCGANYAKAEAIKKQGKAVPVAPVAAAEAPVEMPKHVGLIPGSLIEDPEEVEDLDREWKLCAGAVPVMFLLAIAFHSFEIGHWVQRTFLTMPVHELGHAVAAWFCGFGAIPTFWHTNVSESRGVGTPVVLAGLLGFMVFRAWRAQNYALVALGGALIVVQAVCTLGIREKTAQMVFVFGGDGVGMILAVALMGSFFFGKGSDLYQGGLRWGFLAIGAAAYVDMFEVWMAARRDTGRIPFGEQEGGLLSDATRLVDEHGWTGDELVRRFFVLGVACLVAFLAVWAWGVWRAWQAAKQKG